MPNYGFKCPSCDHAEDIVLPIDRRDDPQQCASCGAGLVRQFESCNYCNAPEMIGFNARGKHGEWLRKPEILKSLKTGEREVARKSHDVYHDD